MNQFARATIVASLFSSGIFVGLAGVLSVEAVVKCIFLEDMKVPFLVFIMAAISVSQSVLKTAVVLARRSWHDHTEVEEHGGSETERAIASGGSDQVPTGSVSSTIPSCVITSTSPPEPGSSSMSHPSTEQRPVLPDPNTPRSEDQGTIHHVKSERKPTPRPNKLRPNAVRIDDESFHPAPFRQHIINHSQRMFGVDGETSSDEEFVAEETTPLISKTDLLISPSYQYHRRNHVKPIPRSKNEDGTRSDARKISIWDLGELLWAFGVLIASFTIWRHPSSKTQYLDPAMALIASSLALWYSVPVVLAAGRILMTSAPSHLDIMHIKEDIQELEWVITVHHLHVWTLDGSKVVATVHVTVAEDMLTPDADEWLALVRSIRKVFHTHGVHSTTIEPKFPGDSCSAV
ncbi:putative Cation efflux protein [Seiridium cardinale]